MGIVDGCVLTNVAWMQSDMEHANFAEVKP